MTMLRRALLVLAVALLTSFAVSRADQVGGGGGAQFPVPVPQASGGTGAGALNCPVGQVLTSNGTAYSCVLAAIGAGVINNDCTIAAQYGRAITTAKGTVGHCTVNVTGLTALGVVVATPLDPGDGAGRMLMINVAAGSFVIYTKTGADGAFDNGFKYAILSL